MALKSKMNAEEAGRYLKLAGHTVIKYYHIGLIKGERDGHNYSFSRSEVEVFGRNRVIRAQYDNVIEELFMLRNFGATFESIAREWKITQRIPITALESSNGNAIAQLAENMKIAYDVYMTERWAYLEGFSLNPQLFFTPKEVRARLRMKDKSLTERLGDSGELEVVKRPNNGKTFYFIYRTSFSKYIGPSRMTSTFYRIEEAISMLGVTRSRLNYASGSNVLALGRRIFENSTNSPKILTLGEINKLRMYFDDLEERKSAPTFKAVNLEIPTIAALSLPLVQNNFFGDGQHGETHPVDRLLVSKRDDGINVVINHHFYGSKRIVSIHYHALSSNGLRRGEEGFSTFVPSGDIPAHFRRRVNLQKAHVLENLERIMRHPVETLVIYVPAVPGESYDSSPTMLHLELSCGVATYLTAQRGGSLPVYENEIDRLTGGYTGRLATTALVGSAAASSEVVKELLEDLIPAIESQLVKRKGNVIIT
jgi:hypothetical protein